MKKLILSLVLLVYLTCSLSAQLTISGTVICYGSGNPMQNVTVELDDGTAVQTFVTDATGQYTFDGLLAGADYSVHFSKEALSPLNGVSTYDLVVIMQEVMNPPFEDPFLFLAADANLSGAVTMFDLLMIRQLILFQITTIQEGIWRFGSEDYDNDPLTGYVNTVPVNDLQTDMIFNFVGVRVADMNQSSVGDCN